MSGVGPVERYLAAIVGHDWAALADAVAEDVVRIGPYGDTNQGREDYVAFLSKLMPTLAGYRMDIDRVLYAADGRAATAELRETVELDGVPTITAEGLVFDLDESGRIGRVAIYIRTPSGSIRPPSDPPEIGNGEPDRR